VEAGEVVQQGQVLGLAGCTGKCSGPHLHFEVLRNGRRQNPLLYLP
jgi:murein DD-endopeptidase MepM/ murein hydrolase activator NlpD